MVDNIENASSEPSPYCIYTSISISNTRTTYVWQFGPHRGPRAAAADRQRRHLFNGCETNITGDEGFRWAYPEYLQYEVLKKIAATDDTQHITAFQLSAVAFTHQGGIL
jgi:hypothetical protein